MKPIKITIFWNPISVNHTYYKGASSYYMWKAAREYKREAIWQAQTQFGNKPLECNLDVEYHYFFKDARKRDHLNYNKVLNDSLNGVVWVDDLQIKSSHHYTYTDRFSPRIELIIREKK